MESVVVVVPVTADDVRLLKAVDLVARIQHGLDQSQAGWAGADDAVAIHQSSPMGPSKSCSVSGWLKTPLMSASG